MKILPEVILAYSFVLGSFYLIYQIIPSAVPVSVQLVDSAYNADADADPRFLCWISPDENINLHELANNAHISCSKLDPGFISSTYVGHRFLLVNADRTISDPPTIVTAQSSIHYIDFAHYSDYDTRENFDIVVEWQNMLLQRRRIATAVALAMLILLMFSRTGTIHNQTIASKQLTTKLSVNEPLMERHTIKAYAVLSMVLNHCGYTLVRRNLQLQTWLTLVADAGGSMALFHWLVGYNTSPSSKNSDALILAVFIFLQLAVDLPRPITYETLLSIVATRWALQYSMFRISASTYTCAAVNANIFLHAAHISALFVADRVVGMEGLKLVNICGVFYAVSGRLFAVSGVDLSKRLLWLGSAVAFTLLSARYNVTVVHAQSSTTVRTLYGATFLLLTVLHAVAIHLSRSGAAEAGDRKPQTAAAGVAVLVARYSLEIYAAHFLVLKGVQVLLQRSGSGW